MPSPKYTLSRLHVTIAILLQGGMLIQPLPSLAADQKAPINQIQNATKILVEPFTTAASADLPVSHLDVAALLTEAIRKQLDDENRFQADLRLPALKLVGVVLSYKNSRLDVQAELYDGQHYLAYSRVEREIDPAGDWQADIDLMAEQLLDELIAELRRPQKQGSSQRFNFSPNHCVNPQGYAGDSACNNGYYSDWGWWRHHHDGYRARDHKDHRNHDQFRVRDEHSRHPHNKQDEQHQEKHHWVTGAGIEHHHKARRIEGAIPARPHQRFNTDNLAPSLETSPTPLNSDLGSGKDTSMESAARTHGLQQPPREKQHDSASSSTPVIKLDSAEGIDSGLIPNKTPRHPHQPGRPINTSSPQPQTSSAAILPDADKVNNSDTLPTKESAMVNKDNASSESMPSSPYSTDTESASEHAQRKGEGHHASKPGATRAEQSISAGSAPTPEVSAPPVEELPQAVTTPAIEPTSTDTTSSSSESLTPSPDTSASNPSPAPSSSSFSSDSAASVGSSSSSTPSSSSSYSSESSSSPASSSSSFSSDSAASSGSSSSSSSSASSTPSYSSPASSSSSDTSSAGNTSSPSPSPSVAEPPPTPEPVQQEKPAEPSSSSTTP